MNATARLGAGAATGLAWVTAAILVLPMLVVVPMSLTATDFLTFPPRGISLRWYAVLVTDPQWRAAAWNSLVTGIGAAALATLVGTPAAWAIVRFAPPWAGFAMTICLLPVIVPVIVVAVAAYRAMASVGLSGTTPGLILVHACLGLPFVVLNVAAVLQRTDAGLERAARVFGATPLRAFLHVTLPQAAPGIVAGALFAFLTSFDDVVVALFLAGVGAETLPVRMWSGIRFEISPAVAAVATLLLALSLALLALYAVLSRRLR